MKILAFSDLHGSAKQARVIVEAAGEADLVIGAGDFCNMRKGLDTAVEMLSGITAPFLCVPGNAESADELSKAFGDQATVLHGSGVTIGGLSIFGLGYGVPPTPFGDWSCDLTEAFAARMLDRCVIADILVVHSPPKGVADQTSQGQSVGSTAIHAAIERLQPRLTVCGHIHDSWGQSGLIGASPVHNLGPFANWFEIS